MKNIRFCLPLFIALVCSTGAMAQKNQTTNVRIATQSENVEILRQTISRTRRFVRMRLLAAVGAAVVALLLVTWGWRSWQDEQYMRRFDGSYVIVNGMRNDNLRQIRPQIEDALSQARGIELTVGEQTLLHDAEEEVLNSISDPEERQRLQQLLEN